MKSTPHLKAHRPDSQPQVSWLLAEGNYTHVYVHNGSYSLSAITLGKVCQRYPYLVRLSQQLAVDPGLIVSWHRPGSKQLVVELAGCGSPQMVVVPRRRIREVRQLLRHLQV
ncbi:LytTR family transcriptional regulator [Spirosoma sp. BT702]|uniref:LytTR family transcriptional regulator n=1 Tax=Spirosoma profusum TaxID=2771354 RepID=A0A926Y322_9BACT|nr:LytTR family transcriptional regulator DNA-binding domain-containing protein [Spirosoma profusum]MBD2701450.1 LytTR family transcriptional regulator [Spirosoma profusum]MBD2701641.1 LytTR family transcriptional regulator [Spirosoma profusum]